MQQQASGTFTVQSTPEPPYDADPGATLRRVSIAKTFVGELEATSKADMISAITEVPGSAAYVAIERVRGALAGKRGTFVLAHTGVMTRGAPSLVVEVVPDSGTDELVGLSGTMKIDIIDKQHHYRFEYTLEGA